MNHPALSTCTCVPIKRGGKAESYRGALTNIIREEGGVIVEGSSSHISKTIAVAEVVRRHVPGVYQYVTIEPEEAQAEERQTQVRAQEKRTKAKKREEESDGGKDSNHSKNNTLNPKIRIHLCTAPPADCVDMYELPLREEERISLLELEKAANTSHRIESASAGSFSSSPLPFSSSSSAPPSSSALPSSSPSSSLPSYDPSNSALIPIIGGSAHR
eukprot:TRINITY_DN5268_c0_g1_i1.p1 TRINITY_DN5268_c0_g1~~TRINITY_DN5268_c0_g1_i1.p1  ORF type:complete len:216 (-),score=51.04 TRINITY_DN5268_c0_g1_i1:39-686(-)